MRFKDKVAIVTGASGGIGFAIAERLGREGARVVMADHSPDKAKARGIPVWRFSEPAPAGRSGA